MAKSKVETLMSSITLGSEWSEVTLEDQTDSYYIMAIKDSTSLIESTIELSDVTQVILDVGIDSGLVDGNNTVKPLTIKRIVLNYDQTPSPYDNETNNITAYLKLQDMPYTFYLKPISINTKTKVDITEGTTPIIINILGIE